jgi:hypothetical protein
VACWNGAVQIHANTSQDRFGWKGDVGMQLISSFP